MRGFLFSKEVILQDQIGKANRNNSKAAQSVGEHGQPIISNKNHRGERGADLSIQQSGRQQMGSPAIHSGDLVVDLLGGDNNADYLDEDSLKLKIRKKKRKVLKL